MNEDEEHPPNPPPLTESQSQSSPTSPLIMPSPPSQPPPLNTGAVLSAAATVSRVETHVMFRLTSIIENDQAEELASLFTETRAHANSTLSFGVPILLKAVRNLSFKVIDFLLENGADPLPSIRYLMCPQAFTSNPECVHLLLKLFPHLDSSVLRHTEGKNLLYRSTSCPDLAIFKYLLNRGVGFSSHDVEILVRLIQHPDHAGSFQMIKEVMKVCGMCIDVRGNIGFSLLKQCLEAKKLDVFQFFVENGADPFHTTTTGLTLMHHACCDPEVILFLHDVGLDVNATDQWGLKPCEESSALPKDVLIVLVLLGQKLNKRQEAEFGVYQKDPQVMAIYSQMKRGDFEPLKLRMLCRKRIRKLLWEKHHQNNLSELIEALPLPRPLRAFVDVKSYSEFLLNPGL